MKGKPSNAAANKPNFIFVAFLLVLLLSILLALNSVKQAELTDPGRDLLINQSEVEVVETPDNTYTPPPLQPTPIMEEPNYNGCDIQADLPPRESESPYERFWEFRGYSTPYLFYGYIEHHETNIMYAEAEGGTDGIEQYVAVYCALNTQGYSNEELLSEIKSYLNETNYTEKNDMRPDAITIKSATSTERWGYDVLDLTLELHYEGYESLSHDVTIVATPDFLYEVMIDGISHEPSLVNQAKSIFNSIELN